MDQKELAKKFHDKKFLKSDDFVAGVDKIAHWIRENKNLVIAAIVILIAIGISIPGLKWYRLNQIHQFNQKFYDAQKSLKKESLYRDLIKDYNNLPASQFVRLKLIDDLIEHNQVDDAQKVILEGLKSQEQDILSTLLVLKNIDLLKDQGKINEAIQFADQNESHVIKTFLGQYQLLKANLYLQLNQKDEARKIYQNLSVVTNLEGLSVSEEYDPEVTEQAKDRLLLLDLGIL